MELEEWLAQLAVALAAAAVGAIVWSAFSRPGLFMRAYPHVLAGLGAVMVFGFGVCVGGNTAAGIPLAAGAGLAAFLLWLVLLPIAQKSGKEAAGHEDANPEDP